MFHRSCGDKSVVSTRVCQVSRVFIVLEKARVCALHLVSILFVFPGAAAKGRVSSKAADESWARGEHVHTAGKSLEVLQTGKNPEERTRRRRTTGNKWRHVMRGVDRDANKKNKKEKKEFLMEEEEEIVRLNVGGVLYATSLATLRKEESFLSAMFSGRHKVVRDAQTGAVFIDRDGVVFRHILNYLRRGKLILGGGEEDVWEELLEEARFFQIASLIELLQPQRVSFPCHEEQQQKEEGEEGLLHWLGTSGGTQPWSNPVTAGTVRVRASKPWYGGGGEALAAKQACLGGICTDARSQWIELDIGKGRLLHLTHYLMHTGGCCKMANWTLQGSVDRETWIALALHENCSWEGTRHTWRVSRPPGHKRGFYRWFRWICTGHDASSPSCYCMHFSAVELYGDLRIANKKKEKKPKK